MNFQSGRPAPREADAIIVSRDPAMLEIVELLKRLAKVPSNVLLSGESGTGKDLAAHALHFWGPRKAEPMVKVDLPSIPAELIESEIFGYERGAFTGAAAGKPGRLENAGAGTIFLDQIGELSSVLQAKLLRVVEERIYERLGGNEPLSLQARIVASAGADLELAVERSLFRRDLFHRLGVFWVRLPPLRERPSDVVPLAEFFLERERQRLSRAPRRFSPEALELIERHRWPGNVRELKGVVEHGALMAEGESIERDDLPPQLRADPSRYSSLSGGGRPSLDQIQKLYIEQVLREVGGNTTRAAEILGISRKSLWERRRRYDLDKEKG